MYRDLTAVDLAKACVRELVERTEIDPASVETVAMGQVIPSVKAPNLAREVVLGDGPAGRHPRAHREPRLRVRERGDRRGRARDRRRACARSGSRAAPRASPTCPCCTAGGWRGCWWRRRGRARSAGGLRAFAGFRPRDLVPEAPAIAEPSTGLTMGQSAEKMARENGISREEQDLIALRSHRNAAAAMDDGRLPPELCAVRLPPAFDRARRHRQPAAPRHVARGARRAAARLRPQVRHGHRRQLLAAHRRRRRGPADVRGSARAPRATSRSRSSARGRPRRSTRADSS